MVDASIKPHGAPVRGIGLPRNSLIFGGTFGKMFRALPPADFGADDASSLDALGKLATAMVASAEKIQEGPDPEESGIPAAYTYFGQFIDHDLTFDPASSLQKQNDPDALVDFRTPRFDLDNVYGRGPDDQPYLYEDGRLFILGDALTGAQANQKAHDLPRSKPSTKGADQRAIIGDPRNDENVIVSQLEGLFHRLHNKVATARPNAPFAEIQREVRFHYQWVVLNDYLPKLVSKAALDAVLPPHAGSGLFKPNLEFYKPRNEAFMPLEFSAAAYRFGHSMVRPAYRLSETVPALDIFSADPARALTGFRKFPNTWAIDWNLFIDLTPRDAKNTTRLQLAYRIDTSIVGPLLNLPVSVAGAPPLNLALRNLQRGWRMRLPSGQDVARAMGLVPLNDEDILIGKFTGDPADSLMPITAVDRRFAGRCPLWTYVLAETVATDMAVATTASPPIKVQTRQLGPVGGRIVAETFVGILAADSFSYVSQDPRWTPWLPTTNGQFGLRELIAAALSWPS